MTLPDDLLAGWEQRWKTEAIEFELEGGAGQAITAREQAVSAGNAKSLVDDDPEELTQEDPLPQTIYRATIRRGEAILVTVPLRIKSSARGGASRDRRAREVAGRVRPRPRIRRLAARR
jgi:hypothetical protein